MSMETERLNLNSNSESVDCKPILLDAIDTYTENYEFLFSGMTWKRGDDYYHYSNPAPTSKDWADSSLFERAALIPQSYYTAVPSEGLTVASPETIASPDVFVKYCSPLLYDPSHPDISAGFDMLHEAEVAEQLVQHPHPNICRYLGYVPNSEGLLVGLCYEKHGKSLEKAVEHDGDEVDEAAVMESIRAGLEHLHSLNLVHNDINPRNIVLNALSSPVIIDFDSCWPKGESLKNKKAGTPDWSEGFSKDSVPENDFYGLERISEWFKDPHALQRACLLSEEEIAAFKAPLQLELP